MSQNVNYVFQFTGLEKGVALTEKLKSNIDTINRSAGQMRTISPGGTYGATSIRGASAVASITSAASSAGILALNNQILGLSRQIGLAVKMFQQPVITAGKGPGHIAPAMAPGTMGKYHDVIERELILAKGSVMGPVTMVKSYGKLFEQLSARRKMNEMSSSEFSFDVNPKPKEKHGPPINTKASGSGKLMADPFGIMAIFRTLKAGLPGLGRMVTPQLHGIFDFIKKIFSGPTNFMGHIAVGPDSLGTNIFNPNQGMDKMFGPAAQRMMRRMRLMKGLGIDAIMGAVGGIGGAVNRGIGGIGGIHKLIGKNEDEDGGGKSTGLMHILRAAGVPREYRMLFTHFAKLGIVVAGVIIGLLALREAIKLLLEGIKEGSEAYKTAAAQGLDVRTSRNINQAFAAVGMQTPNLQGGVSYQLGQGRDTEALLQAARSGQFGEQGQQLLNMADEFRRAMADSESSARQMEKSSKATFDMQMEMQSVIREWKTLLTQLSTNMYNTIQPFLDTAKYLLQAANIFYEVGIWMKQKLGILPTAGGNQQYQFKGGVGGASTTSLEKLGFVMNSARGPDKHLADISRNTGFMVTSLNTLIGLFNVFLQHGPNTGIPGQSYMHLPQIPQ